MNLAFHCAILLVGLLWSDVIGDEQPMPPMPHPGVSGPMQKQTGLTPGSGRPKITGVGRPNIDEEAFQLSFRRQAQKDLLKCLYEKIGPRGRLVLRADLTKAGKLRNTSALNAELPACAKRSMEDMSFDHLTKEMRSDFAVLQWALDW
ncbi:MAG: hypothetical protein AB7T49_13265 [Oligoflexales bacterium]